MSDSGFQDAALVLIAHGSSVNANSGGAAQVQADSLRRRGLFGEVAVAYWKQPPFLADVVPGLSSPRLFLIPLFISDGWFSENVIPRALGLRGPDASDFPRVQQRGAQVLRYGRAVGSHPSMTGVLLARARGVVEGTPPVERPSPGDTALVIVGHGTAYSRGSRESIEREVERIRSERLYAEVQPAFLEESPRVGDCFEITSARNLVLVPFFVADGLHTQEDIPVMLGDPESEVRERIASGQPSWRNPTERHGRRVWVAPAIGTEPLLAEVILERVQEAASWSA